MGVVAGRGWLTAGEIRVRVLFAMAQDLARRSLSRWSAWAWPVAAVVLAVAGQPAVAWPWDAAAGLRPPDLTGAALAALVALPLALAEAEPLAAFALSGLSLLLFKALHYPGEVPVLATLILVAWVAVRRPLWLSAVSTGLLVGGMVAVATLARPRGVPHVASHPPASSLVSQVLVLVVVLLAGAVLRGQRRRTALAQREQAVALDRLMLEAERAAAAERLRVARQLHDSVGHGITRAGLLAQATAHALSEDPDQAQELLAELVGSAQEAMAELHGLVGVLRDADGSRLADGDDMESLVQRFTRSGMEVNLEVDEGSRRLPQAVAVAARATVAEGLANVARHAGTRRAAVAMRRSGHDVVIEVADDGRGPPGGYQGWGHGLAGAAERVGALGGRLHFGPSPSGGGLLRAVIPCSAGPPR